MSTKRDKNAAVAQETTPTGAMAGLDDMDASILRYLERNGRATNYEVG